MLLADDLSKLFDILPKHINKLLEQHPHKDQLVEIVLDLGRRPEARFSKSTSYLSYRTVVWQDLDYIIKRLGKFNSDNRAGIEKTLHRVSSLRNKQGIIIGLTCRIGRAVFGTLGIIRDLLEQKKSILLLGRPGVGKTTAIREIGRVLSDGMKKRVIIVDTSNEIAGDGDLPHLSIGKARRMQLSNTKDQDEIMVEAVENHMPEIIIIDEIGTELEAAAARTIAERGVQLVGTAHGNALENLIKNPTITDLIGGIQYVTLGDEEAKRRGTSKSILERKAPPTFEVAIEINDSKTWVVHDNIEYSVDILLQGQSVPLQKRTITGRTQNFVECKIVYDKKEIVAPYYNNQRTTDNNKRQNDFANQKNYEDNRNINLLKGKDSIINLKTQFKKEFTFLYIYGINNQNLKSLIKTLRLPFLITKEIQYADSILALSNLIKNNRKLRHVSHSKKITIHTIRNNSLVQIAKVLKLVAKKNALVPLQKKNNKDKITKIISQEFLTPCEEVRLVIEEIVIPQKKIVELFPRPSTLRKQQHAQVCHYNLRAISIGKKQSRRLRIYPN